MSIRNGIILIVLMVGLGLQPATRTHADARCFSETNQCIDGRFREFWEQNGGLAIFGFPISGEQQSTVDGKTFTVQRFERNRLELHPENARPYDVLLGRLGADRLAQQGRDWFTFPKNGDIGGCKVFAETGHTVCRAVLNAWRKSGLKLDTRNAVSEAESLALFGLPLSDLQTETMSNGQQYQVQWFERARFELHPENSAPYDVLLGLLGNEVGGAPAPAPAATVQTSAPAPTGPGSQYVPLQKRMFASYMLENWGYKLDDWKTAWVVSSDYAQGLADSSATIQSAGGLRTNLVQHLIVSSSMQSRSGNLWTVVYSITEFTNTTSAGIMYYDISITDHINEIENKSFPGPCFERWVIGMYNGAVPAGELKLWCGNKVLNITVGGFGSTDEFMQLFESITQFFVGSFYW